MKDLTPPNDKRRLQGMDDNLAGPDVKLPAFRDTQLPLAIPSTKLNLAEYNVPERLLQIFLSNYRGQSPAGEEAANRVTNLVEEHIEDGTAEPINLSATFSSDIGPSYEYNLGEMSHLNEAPPSYIKITRTPRNGELVVKRMGKEVVLSEGDLIESSMLKEFSYQQGHEGCTAENLGACHDDFNYVPYGEWVGMGNFQETKIQINPVSRETLISGAVGASSLESAIGETTQLKKEAVAVSSGTCPTYPIEMLSALGVVIIALVLPLGIAASKVRSLSGDEKTTQLSEFSSKNALQLQAESSVEATLKKGAEKNE